MTDRFRQITRRTVLRGAGATLTLPWLAAMTPDLDRLGAAPPAPLRLACLFMPNGVLPSHWTPKSDGGNYTLSPSLEPLAPVKQHVLVLTGMRNKKSHFGEGHYTKTAALLTGEAIRKTGGTNLRNAVSVDQLAARHVGETTRLASLELGIDPVRPVVDMGFSTVYGGHVSWRTPTTPAPKEIDPRRAFDRLFRTLRTGSADLSVLDLVREDARRLRRKVGQADRNKLDEYLESVRALERRVEAWTKRRPVGLPPASPTSPNDHAAHVDLMLDLIVTAFRSGATRIASFMFGNAVSGKGFSFLDGVNGGHHHLSHHQNKPDLKRQYQLINRWHVAQVAKMLQRMREIPDGDGTLLDHSMVFFASGLRDGNRHDPNNLPVLLGGGAGGRLVGGRPVKLRMHTPLCNLHLTMLRCLDVPVESFGDSRGIVKEILRG